MKTLYFDCFSGISGDMTIGALLDLGLDFDYLKTELQRLPFEGYQLAASRVVRSNISAMKFDVLMEGGPEHEHEHGHDPGHHHHDHGPHEQHDHHDEHGHGDAEHFHRTSPGGEAGKAYIGQLKSVSDKVERGGFRRGGWKR